MSLKIMNPDINLSKFLGAASIGAGAVGLLAPRRVNQGLGLGLPHWALRLLGLQKAVSGFVVLAHPDEAGPIGVRLANDALELALLSQTLLPGRKVTNGAILGAVVVLGATALDLAAGASLRRRKAQVLETGRRTRYRPA